MDMFPFGIDECRLILFQCLTLYNYFSQHEILTESVTNVGSVSPESA
jgi:hypothetical protein